MSRNMVQITHFFFCVCCLLVALDVRALPAGFSEREIFSGLQQPTSFKFAPNGPQVFVTEKRGVVKLFDSVNSSSGRIIYDISSDVYTKFDNGLSSIAVHPDFPSTPYIYIAYSKAPAAGNEFPGEFGARLDRLEVNAQLTGVSQVTQFVDNWCVSSANHATGDLQFGPEGALYMSAGSFASSGQFNSDCNEPFQQGGSLKSQDFSTPGDHLWYNGTMIRLDPISGAPWPGNALNGGSSDDDPIIAYGLRNPFRFVIHPDSHEVYIADVGWERAEEINRISDPNALPNNYGWPCYEGENRQPTYDNINVSVCEQLYQQNSDSKPFFAYGLNPAGAGLSITGIAINGGQLFPQEYSGALFYADYVKRYINVMYAGPDGSPNRDNIEQFDSGRPIVQVSMGPDGKLYYIEFNVGENGEQERYAIWQVAPAEAFVAKIEADTIVAPGSTVVFDADKTTQRDGSSNRYEWDLDSDGLFDDGEGVNRSFTYPNVGSYVVSLRATNDAGETSVSHHMVLVTDDIPVPHITSPVEGQKWGTGQMIDVAGFANIPSSGAPADHLTWTISLRHCERADENACHGHPVTIFDDNDPNVPVDQRNRFEGPDHDYPSHLQVQLTAFGPPAGVEWALPAWEKRSAIFINNVSGPQHDNFALKVILGPNDIDHAVAGTQGASLRFTDAQGSLVQHFVESWNVNGESVVWVAIGQLQGNSVSQFLRMYFGNTSSSNASDNAGMNLWDQANRTHIGDVESKTPLQSSLLIPFFPRTSILTLDSEPRGLEVNVFTYSDTTPFDVETIEGAVTNITAPDQQVSGGFLFAFDSWDNGMPRAVDDFITPVEGATILARYQQGDIVNCRWDAMFFRGTPNDWNATPMTMGVNCQWHLEVEFSNGDNPRFKFDASGSWADAYTDSDNNGFVDQGQGDIAIVDGIGRYRILLNDDLSYSVQKINAAQPPVANAGPDQQVAAGAAVILNGSLSQDADGSIASYAWSGNGIDGTLTGVEVSQVFTVAGSYTVTLTVTDNDGLVSTDSVLIEVSDSSDFASNFPSMFMTGTFNSWTPGQTAMTLVDDFTWQLDLDLTASDAFKFTPFADWSVSFGENGGADNINVVSGSGRYRVRFFDNNNTYQMSSLTVSNLPPQVTITSPMNNVTVSIGDVVNLSATASDPEDGVLNASVTWMDELGEPIGTGANISTSFAVAGRYQVFASVTDSAGQAVETMVVIDVADQQTDWEKNFDIVHVTGVHNNWTLGQDPMTLVGNHQWRVTLSLPENAQFKFTPLLDWSVSFGENGGADNISVTQGAGIYEVNFNDQTRSYTLIKQ